MKNDEKILLRVGVIISGIIILCFGALWLLDSGFNGVVKEWFYNRFIIAPDYLYEDKLGVLFKTWYEIKQFLIIAFISFITVLVIITSISTYLYGRYRSKKDVAIITRSINSFFNTDTDELMLPKKYSEIERQLMRIKAMSQRNQQLVQTEMQRKNDLITYLAHDLKTPLASIIGYLSLLDEAPDMPIEQKTKYSWIALEKAYRLEELINEFFDITRFNLQSIVLNKGKIKLEFMLHQLVDEFYPLLEPQGKQVVIHVPEDLILVGDADKLARVFNNILKNAIAYSYENSIIDISAVQNGDSITITFRNQGETIPSHKLDTIFDKFYRLDTARSTNTGGAGLGLAIAKEIVIAHNGTITVESNIENTTFTIVIPS
ncbi:HAMP domain-containing sensor histidine kinase [Tissierella sp. Yu-01]|uniref:sensor histidine kinase n=1 Tax=Tissierella sp. Yu-01 TaxID=3035694 RepID=UPI00321BA7E9